eukprot:443734-Rhodomonas_salina.1
MKEATEKNLPTGMLPALISHFQDRYFQCCMRVQYSFSIPQLSHAFVVQVAFGGELLLSLEHSVEAACCGEDGIAKQRVAPAGALLIVSQVFNKL